jgi:hypothetical protein
MNVRLRCSFDFVAGTWFEQQLMMCNYTVKLDLLTQTLEPEDQNTAIDRVRWFFDNRLQNVIFVHQAEMERAEAFYDLGLDVCTLPEEPVDQVVGIVLHSKLNAVMQDRIRITELTISSDTGGIEYIHDNSDVTELLGTSGWWFDPDTRCNDIESDDKDTVKDWPELELSWSSAEVIKDIDTAIFVNLPANETKH